MSTVHNLDIARRQAARAHQSGVSVDAAIAAWNRRHVTALPADGLAKDGRVTVDEMSVRKMLATKCREAGGQKRWAETAGVSPAYVCDVLLGHRRPGKAILGALGLEEVTFYRNAGVAGRCEEPHG